MLKDVLDEARAEASRTFVGPVAQRARVHVERLFPGADLSFDEELGLASVTRSGLSEACGTLSKGQQETLAVLKIGRASCRERGGPLVVVSVVVVSIKKK